MKNILIPTDFSEDAWKAIQYAQLLFEEVECNFYCLHVSDLVEYAIVTANSGNSNETDVANGSRMTASKKQLNDFLKAAEDHFTNPNHHFFGIHDHGFFIDSIKKHAEEKKIDLIVMGTKGATGLRKRIIGSNTGDVITKVPYNTLVIPKEAELKKPEEIAFPTDYNIFYSHKILEALSEMIRLGDQGNFRVMHVTRLGGILTREQKKNQEYLHDFLMESFPKNNSFHTLTNKSVNAAIQCFVESRDIDMIIMVAKNLNFLQQMLFDPLVEKISFHTNVPFFVIHE